MKPTIAFWVIVTLQLLILSFGVENVESKKHGHGHGRKAKEIQKKTAGKKLIKLESICQKDADCESGKCCPELTAPPMKTCATKCVNSLAKRYNVSLMNEFKEAKMGNKMYKVFYKDVTWLDAALLCCKEQMKLASPQKIEELEFVTKLAKSLLDDGVFAGQTGGYGTQSSVWMDGADIDNEKIFTHVFSPKSPLVDTKLMYEGHGNLGGTAENCMACKWYGSNKNNLIDVPCSVKKPFMCEKDATAPQTKKSKPKDTTNPKKAPKKKS